MIYRRVLYVGALCLGLASLVWSQSTSSTSSSTSQSGSSQTTTTTTETQITDPQTGATSTARQTATTTTPPPGTPSGTTGTLSGSVTAGAGVGVPNASIIVTDASTGVTYRAMSGADGSFSITLPPGTYRLDVETGGLRRLSKENVVLTHGATLRLDLIVESDDTRESVEVKAVSPVAQSDTAERAMGFGTRTMRQMPIIDRNAHELIGLMSGVMPPMPNTTLLGDPQRNRLLYVNGQPDIANSFNLDGIDNNEPFQQIAIHVQPLEGIQQMNVRTANYNAEFGRAGGAIVHTMTRPGTNDLHGSLFEFHNSSFLNARNFFNSTGQPMARNTWNQFGGSVGGPIIRDKTYFFVTYEGQYHRGQQTKFASVPLNEWRGGNFSNIPGLTLFNPNTGDLSGAGRIPFLNNMIRSNQFNLDSQQLLSQFPSPNLSGVENNYMDNAYFRNDYHRGNARLDHHFSERSTWWLRYNYSRYFTLEESVLPRVLGSGGEGRLRTHNAHTAFNHSFSPTLLTDLRLGYNRYEHQLNPFAEQALFGSQLSGFSGFPAFSIAGNQYGAPAGLPNRGVDNTFNLVSNWGAIMGRHTIKFGADFRRIRADGWQNTALGPAGSYMFTPGAVSLNGGSDVGSDAYAASVASFLLGAPTSASATFLNGLTPTYRATHGFGWFSDTIQLMPRLSLDIGVRYEVYRPWTSAHDFGLYNYDPLTNTVVLSDSDGSLNVDTDWGNIAPRLGIAFRVGGGTVLRAGYAISHFPVPISIAGGNAFTFLNSTQSGVPGGFGAGSFTGLPGNVIPVPDSGNTDVAFTPAGNAPLRTISPDMQTPYVQSYNFSIQHEFGSGMLFDVAYVGTLGRQLPFLRELNAAAPGTGLGGMPLFQQFGRTASTVEYGHGLNNNYNSLQANLTKRFSHGLAMQVSYTWSQALDFASSFPTLSNNFDIAGTYGMLINNLDPRANYAPADYHRQQVFNFSHLWELPFGAGTNRWNQGWVGHLLGNWQLNGIFRWASGNRFNVYADPTHCNCPGNTPLANVIGDPSSAGLFDRGQVGLSRADFAIPAPGTFGNLGRNALRGPAFYNYDLSVFRSFPIREQVKLEFRGEAYNLTNRPQFGNPIGNLSSSLFGQTWDLRSGGNNRQLNLGARLVF